MDRSLKERLAGAVVLVALAVWLIPQVLDGPNDSGSRTTQSLTLPAPADNTGMRTQTVRLDDKQPAPAVEPAPVSRTTPSSTAAPAPAKPKPKTTPAEPKPAPSSTPTSAPGWFVQLGSFAERANAARLADTITELGFAAEVSRYSAGGAVLHRVRVGPRPSRVGAEGLASELARRGYPGQVVPGG